MIRVMLCDDHLGFLDGVIEFLKKYPDFEVVGKATSGKECILLLEDTVEPDILLLDISMPGGISGYEVAKIIHQKKLPVKVIALSMLDDLQAIRAMIRFGAKGFIYKGNSLKGIDEIIQTVYDGNEYYPEEVNFTPAQIEEIKYTPIPWLENMHPQEWEIIQSIANDHSQKTVSKQLDISDSLVSKRLRSLCKKTGSNSSIGLINFFKSVGMIK